MPSPFPDVPQPQKFSRAVSECEEKGEFRVDAARTGLRNHSMGPCFRVRKLRTRMASQLRQERERRSRLYP